MSCVPPGTEAGLRRWPSMQDMNARLLSYIETLNERIRVLRERRFEEGSADRAASEAAADELERVVAEVADLIIID